MPGSNNTHKNKTKATKIKKQLTNYKLKLQTLGIKEKKNITQLRRIKKSFNKRRNKSA
jgi:hypothetical protein